MATALGDDLHELTSLFWAAFEAGVRVEDAGMRIEASVQQLGWSRYYARVKLNHARRVFRNKRRLEASLECCRSAGRIAAELAQDTGEISRSNFESAVEGLEKERRSLFARARRRGIYVMAAVCGG